MSALQVGTVFRICSGEGWIGVGQIAAFHYETNIYTVLFSIPWDRPVEDFGPEDLSGHDPVLAGETLSDLVRGRTGPVLGTWPVLGVADIDPTRFLPASKSDWGRPDMWVLEDYTADRCAWITPEQAEYLPFHHSFSLAVFVHALQALNGEAEWLDGFDDLLPENIVLETQVFDGEKVTLDTGRLHKRFGNMP
jgi:hypothetical protein